MGNVSGSQDPEKNVEKMNNNEIIREDDPKYRKPHPSRKAPKIPTNNPNTEKKPDLPKSKPKKVGVKTVHVTNDSFNVFSKSYEIDDGFT